MRRHLLVLIGCGLVACGGARHRLDLRSSGIPATAWSPEQQVTVVVYHPYPFDAHVKVVLGGREGREGVHVEFIYDADRPCPAAQAAVLVQDGRRYQVRACRAAIRCSADDDRLDMARLAYQLCAGLQPTALVERP